MDKPLPSVEFKYLGVLLAPAVMQMFYQPTEERAEGTCKFTCCVPTITYGQWVVGGLLIGGHMVVGFFSVCYCRVYLTV